ncbi:MAG: hypothetical protein UX30_C0002G0038 [Candidatus Saccharibacteria bacterium GW2011_GWA2_46_10]|nr:MAG: hypothetical protein UX30_C0002G0038 [Candidatus Saccharibacteria bacterium GW2011_GWA2_46_10]
MVAHLWFKPVTIIPINAIRLGQSLVLNGGPQKVRCIFRMAVVYILRVQRILVV